MAFIATYLQPKNNYGGYEDEYTFRFAAPYANKEPDIPDEIKDLSKYFKEIYTQAHSAEHHRLDQIAGMGYRKALEFLIKDYCISKHADKEMEIKSEYLGVCINKYINDAKIQKCAKLSAWLGNDETHYVRKWEDKDIADLKILIRLTVNWISNDILTEKYSADMDP